MCTPDEVTETPLIVQFADTGGSGDIAAVNVTVWPAVGAAGVAVKETVPGSGTALAFTVTACTVVTH
jgi:hypothetical protein